MKIKRNGKVIDEIDRRTRENAHLRKGGKVADEVEKTTRTRHRAKQMPKLTFRQWLDVLGIVFLLFVGYCGANY